MKKQFLFFAFLIASLTLSAQNWKTNFEEAKLEAQKDNKHIVLVFAGSDWCTSCIKLDQSIFKSKEFIEYANENWVLYKADFPRKKKHQLSKELAAQNSALAEKYNSYGYFPLVLVLDAKGNEIGKTSYKNISPKAYIEELKNL